jgi:hypothetical protein
MKTILTTLLFIAGIYVFRLLFLAIVGILIEKETNNLKD